MTEQIFEWDPKKSEANFRKHGINFDESREAFYDPLRKLELEGTDYGEVRWRTIGAVKGAI